MDYVRPSRKRASVCLTRQFRILILRRNRLGQSDLKNGIRPPDSRIWKNGLVGRAGKGGGEFEPDWTGLDWTEAEASLGGELLIRAVQFHVTEHTALF